MSKSRSRFPIPPGAGANDAATHEEFRNALREQHRVARVRVDEAIGAIIERFRRFDPFPVIAELSIRNCFVDPETYNEPESEQVEALAEYAQSLALAIAKPGKDAPSVEVIDECCALIEEALEATELYFSTEFTQDGYGERYPGVEAEVRFMTVMRTLKMRGDSVQEHHDELFLALFEPHKTFLRARFGFSASEFVSAMHAIDETLVERVGDYEETRSRLLEELQKQFDRFVARRISEGPVPGNDQINEEFFALPATEQLNAEKRRTRESISSMFDIAPDSTIKEKILDFLSADAGSNLEFLDGNGRGWPIGESIIRRKPAVRRDGRYYLFNPLLLSRVLIDMFETAVREADAAYFRDVYLPKRSALLEESVLEHLVRLLPGAKVYRNLKYEAIDDGKTKLFETDAILIFDRYLFIIEDKAGGVTRAAHRAAIARIKEHLENLIADAAKQGFRTRDYIAEHSPARFRDSSGRDVEVPNLDSFDGCFVITPTLTPLAHFAARLAVIRQLASLPNGAWPWSVFLNDLRIISEIVESPAEFVLYLERRLLANETVDIATTDELDYLMYFLCHGMFFGNEAGPNGKQGMVLAGYTVDLDRYYSWKGGRRSTGEKPRFNVSDEMRAFVRRIEETGEDHRTCAASSFLALDAETRKMVIDSVRDLRTKRAVDGEDHSLTFSAGATGYHICIVPEPNADASLHRLRSYSEMKKYQWRKDRWVQLAFVEGSDGAERMRVFVDTSPWKQNDVMEKRVAAFQQDKLRTAISSGVKIGRNDLCPCNSGRKYKKCCGRSS